MYRWVKTRKYEWIEDDSKTYPSRAQAITIGPPQGNPHNEGIGTWGLETEIVKVFNPWTTALRLGNHCEHERQGKENCNEYQTALSNAIKALNVVKRFW